LPGAGARIARGAVEFKPSVVLNKKLNAEKGEREKVRRLPPWEQNQQGEWTVRRTALERQPDLHSPDAARNPEPIEDGSAPIALRLHTKIEVMT
jgi:hypothetical protein